MKSFGRIISAIALSVLAPTIHAQVSLTFNIEGQEVGWTERGNLCNVRNTALALGSWGTAVSYDNLSLQSSRGDILYQTDFSNATDYQLNWNANGGIWNTEGGTLNQTSTTIYGQCNVCYNMTGEDCIIELDATKSGGSEGFLVAFSYNDPDNFVWWNLGGWNNTQHAIEQCVDGMKTTLSTMAGTIETGRRYHLRIVKADQQVSCYLDDQLCHRIALTDTRRINVSAGLDRNRGELTVTLANPLARQQDVAIKAANFSFGSKASLRVQRQGGGTVTTSSLTLSDLQIFGYTMPADVSSVVISIPVSNISDMTGIQSPAEDVSPSRKQKITSLDGRQLPVGTPMRPGIYIINGKLRAVKP